jgi:probable phosphoglycerate mutase
VAARADRVLSAVVEQLVERDVVLVGHGHFSRALIVRWLELPVVEGRRFAFSDPAYSVLGFDRGVSQVKCHNRVPCDP